MNSFKKKLITVLAFRLIRVFTINLLPYESVFSPFSPLVYMLFLIFTMVDVDLISFYSRFPLNSTNSTALQFSSLPKSRLVLLYFIP
uniref:Uncharacterized protein n=1 Tax=Heterorhabditis bacteriophora TaxID=37862 RepID=A0A1I7WFK2_HETBA